MWLSGREMEEVIGGFREPHSSGTLRQTHVCRKGKGYKPSGRTSADGRVNGYGEVLYIRTAYYVVQLAVSGQGNELKDSKKKKKMWTISEVAEKLRACLQRLVHSAYCLMGIN